MSAGQSAISLIGKRVLITGGARGLGAAFAEAAAGAGARLVIADIRDEEGKTVAETLRASGADAHYIRCDLADPDMIEQSVREATGLLGGLDGLVNNGAIATGIGGKTLDDLDIETWDRVMSVNVRGTWLTTRAAHPFLAKSGQGKVINIASDTALWGAPKLMHYVASKGAVIAMTRAMARELGEEAIAVNAIAPGLTLVEATEYVPQDRHDHYIDGRAIRRAQHPQDITGTVLFLLSDAADFVTGQVIPVNGGFVLN